ncbi:MAG: hypothetical protein SGPRY_001295 [Prymnesium sp.]
MWAASRSGLQKQTLLQLYLDAVETAFSEEAGASKAAMLASPLAAMQRPARFLDPAGDAAAAIWKLDADMQAVQEALEKAGAGLDPASLLAPGLFSPAVGEAFALSLWLMQVTGFSHPDKPQPYTSVTH